MCLNFRDCQTFRQNISYIEHCSVVLGGDTDSERFAHFMPIGCK